MAAPPLPMPVGENIVAANYNALVHSLFPYLPPRDAFNLCRAFGVLASAEDLSSCDCKCECLGYCVPPGAQSHPRQNELHEAAIPGIEHPLAVHHACTRQALWRNVGRATPGQLAGPREPSICEAQNWATPVDRMHGYPDGEFYPTICQPCKASLAAQLEWKRDQVKYGVCKRCRDWAVENMAPGEDACTCLENTIYDGNTTITNNFEPKVNHLCEPHSIDCWNDITTAAVAECRARKHMYRKRKRGNGWTHTKGRKPPMTPIQRRRTAGIRYTQGAELFPRCFCGADIDAEGHQRGVPHLSDRVRNCLGCNNFIRRW